MNPNDEAAVSAAMATMAAPYEARVREIEAENKALASKLQAEQLAHEQTRKLVEIARNVGDECSNRNRELVAERNSLAGRLEESEIARGELAGHGQGLINEVEMERAARIEAENRLEECLDLIADAVANHDGGGRCEMDLARAAVVLAMNEPVVEKRRCFSCVSPEACEKDGCQFFKGPMIAPGSE